MASGVRLPGQRFAFDSLSFIPQDAPLLIEEDCILAWRILPRVNLQNKP
jgi:hypothetical protein